MLVKKFLKSSQGNKSRNYAPEKLSGEQEQEQEQISSNIIYFGNRNYFFPKKIKKLMNILKFLCFQKFHHFYHANPNLNRNAAQGYFCRQQPMLRPFVIVRVRVLFLMMCVHIVGFCAFPKGQGSMIFLSVFLMSRKHIERTLPSRRDGTFTEVTAQLIILICMCCAH